MKKDFLKDNVEQNILDLRCLFDKCEDIIFKELVINLPALTRSYIIYADSLCDTVMINDFILKALLQEHSIQTNETTNNSSVEIILERLIPSHNAQLVTEVQKLTDLVLNGFVIIMVINYYIQNLHNF